MTLLYESARQILRGFADRRVLCVGDLMLDRYLYGTVDRISPEAPIPVLHAQRESQMLGGAGNVVRNLKHLGVEPVLLSAVGEDAPGAEAERLLAEDGINAMLLRFPDRHTTTKLRLVATAQQVLRVDWEHPLPLDEGAEDALLAMLSQALDGVDGVVISDYGKGLLTPRVLAQVIGECKARELPCAADPKGRDFARYRGATVLTPNRKELEQAGSELPLPNDAAVLTAARQLLDGSGVEAVLATLGARGMVLVTRGSHGFLDAQAREVYDVSGAGDTVVAVLIAALASGATLEQGAQLANEAAGLVVGKSGTATVSREELLQAFRRADRLIADSKFLAQHTLAERVTEWRTQGLTIGFANGCFDLLHPGHIHLIRQARSRCDRLVVAINSDASVRRLKGADRPLQPAEARGTVLSSLSDVDAVTVFDDDTPLALIEALVPDVLIKGADYADKPVVGREVVEAAGGEVFLAELRDGFSTTGTAAKISKSSSRPT